MLGSPIATSEGGIDVITDVRDPKFREKIRKTGGIDVRHFWRFSKVLDSSWEGNWLLKYWTIQHPFIFFRARICLVGQRQTQSYVVTEWLPAEKKLPLTWGRYATPRYFTRPVRVKNPSYFRDLSRVSIPVMSPACSLTQKRTNQLKRKIFWNDESFNVAILPVAKYLGNWLFWLLHRIRSCANLNMREVDKVKGTAGYFRLLAFNLQSFKVKIEGVDLQKKKQSRPLSQSGLQQI